MKLVINAITIDPGGGMTVVKGLVHGLRHVSPEMDITVLTSYQPTYESISSLGNATKVVQILPGASPWLLFLWQNIRLGKWLQLNHADILLTVNLFVHNIGCPQVVYHLNQLRFTKPLCLAGFWSSPQDWVRDWLAHRALSSANGNVFCSRFLLETAQNVHSCAINNAYVIYYGRPLEPQPSNYDFNVQSNSRRIVAITSPSEHKDNPTLIRTLAQLINKSPDTDWRLDIAGGTDPSKWEPTRCLARDLGVLDRVTWHGFSDHKKISDLLSHSLCYISTSRVEAFPTVVPEAMSWGCPPVVANCAAMPESVGDAGLLVIPGSAESFSEAILCLATNPGLREDLVRRGDLWSKQFSWFNCGSQFRKIFKDLVVGKD